MLSILILGVISLAILLALGALFYGIHLGVKSMFKLLGDFMAHSQKKN